VNKKLQPSKHPSLSRGCGNSPSCESQQLFCLDAGERSEPDYQTDGLKISYV